MGRQLAAEPEARAHVRRTDARVESDPFEDRPDIRPGPLGQTGQLVGEGDLECQERIGSVLDEFRLLERDETDGRPEGPEELHERGLRGWIRRSRATDDDPMRRGEVCERGSLGKELRDGEEQRLIDDVVIAEETLAGPDRCRAADHRDGSRLERPDLSEDSLDRAHVGVAPIVDRRSHADEDDLRGGARRPVQDLQVARLQRRGQRILDAWFTEREATVPELDEALGIRLDQLDRMAHPGQPDGTHETDIPGADHGDGSARRPRRRGMTL